MSKVTVREFLRKYAIDNDYAHDEDDDLAELLTESVIIHRAGRDTHRWYIRELVVVDIGGVFIQFWDYIITGDGSMSDMDLKYDLDLASIVKRKERVVTEIYYE